MEQQKEEKKCMGGGGTEDRERKGAQHGSVGVQHKDESVRAEEEEEGRNELKVGEKRASTESS